MKILAFDYETEIMVCPFIISLAHVLSKHMNLGVFTSGVILVRDNLAASSFILYY